MFYDKYIKLCEKKGISPSKAAEEIGFNKSSITNWKNNGYTPRQEILVKISDYFGVTTDFLLDNESTELINNDTELTSYLEELKNRPEMRMLFSITKSCTKEEVEQAVRIIEALRNEN